MTKNQIEYQKLLETRRANMAQEALTGSRDEASRRLGLDTLQETTRHNQQVELQARDNLAEQYRNNVAQLQELQRSHLASEGILQQKNALSAESMIETARHNQASEAETVRHNQANEDISLLQSNVSRIAAELSASSHTAAAGISAAASMYASDQALLAKQLQIDLDKYGIDTTAQTRANELRETSRSNLARETETNRTNTVNEALKAGSLVEQVRNNIVGNIQRNVDLAITNRLGTEKNRIAAAQQQTQQRQVEANISLVPSQKFSNYAHGASQLANAIVNGATKLYALEGS